MKIFRSNSRIFRVILGRPLAKGPEWNLPRSARKGQRLLLPFSTNSPPQWDYPIFNSHVSLSTRSSAKKILPSRYPPEHESRKCINADYLPHLPFNSTFGFSLQMRKAAFNCCNWTRFIRVCCTMRSKMGRERERELTMATFDSISFFSFLWDLKLAGVGKRDARRNLAAAAAVE